MRTLLAIASMAFFVPGCPGNAPPHDATTPDAVDAPADSESETAVDAGPPPEPCASEGSVTCSADGYALRTCRSGFWTVTTACMADHGQLCEVDHCVDPWRYGSPTFPDCTDNPLATPTRLVDKARAYDDLAQRLHVHPALGWMMGVHLRPLEITCPAGATPPCYDDTRPGVPLSSATYMDVVQWDTQENDGLWSSLYLMSQVYRYAATHDAAALSMIRTLMNAESARMRITGVPGLFTRQFIPPGVPGIACPTNLSQYVPAPDKSANRWLQIRSDGCAWVVDGTTMQWTPTTHCGLPEFAGYCWLDNVSKDEYSGHIFSLGLVWRLVDDAAIRAQAADMLHQVGVHLATNQLNLIDWDGHPTHFGHFSALALDDYPGFNAAMAMDFTLQSSRASGDATVQQFFDNCLMQYGGFTHCLSAIERPMPYTNWLNQAGMYIGPDGCLSNYNNLSMHMLSLQGLVDFAYDPRVRDPVQHSLNVDVFRAPMQLHAMQFQHNPWFDFIWASHKRLGPASDGPALDAVHDAICQLHEFPDTYVQTALTLPPSFTPYCTNRFGEPTSQAPRTASQRCAATYVWWGDPYDLRVCTDDARHVLPPTGYLLPYWLGRYYGFISPEQ